MFSIYFQILVPLTLQIEQLENLVLSMQYNANLRTKSSLHFAFGKDFLKNVLADE